MRRHPLKYSFFLLFCSDYRFLWGARKPLPRKESENRWKVQLAPSSAV
eukprot:gene5037-3627_t